MVAFAQRSFTAGEISPSLYARTDQAKYSIALRTLRNFFVRKSGGAVSRPGTEYIAEVKDSTKKVRLIPFIFNDSQTYILEFGDQYIRFYKDGVQLTSGGSPYEVSTPYLEADLFDLGFAQSADVLTIVHPSYAPRDLSRTGDTSWTLTTITFTPSISPVQSLSNDRPSAIVNYGWTVTAVNSKGEESLGATTRGHTSTLGLSSSNKFKLTWAANSDAIKYRVYRILDGEVDGVGFIGETTESSFIDDGIEPTYADIPPSDPDYFNASNDYPSAVSYYQQRRIFANSNNAPEGVWLSFINSFKNFISYQPIADDNSIFFNLVGRQVNEILHIVDLDNLFLLTTGGEWSIDGDDSRIIRPSSINARQRSYNGSSSIRPIVVNDTIIYVQSRGSIVRDMYHDNGLVGSDLTIFSHHLFDGKTVVDWGFQRSTNSILWIAMSDGGVLGLTYVREQQVYSWHRHDFQNGLVESIEVVPEGTEDYVYMAIKRTINGSTVRYIERFTSREISEGTDITDSKILDSSLSLDGTNETATVVTISGGSSWDHTETLTLTANSAIFVSGDVGNAIHLTDADGNIIIFTITGFTSTLIVTGRVNRDVPAGLQGMATTQWGKAVDEISGLDHLEGEDVSVFADGYVVGSPNNPKYSTYTVSSGAITLDRPYVKIHVGLPITSDIETLDIDNFEGEPLSNQRKNVTEITVYLKDSRGFWAGKEAPTGTDATENLREYVSGKPDAYSPPSQETKNVTKIIRSNWNNHGRVFIRNVDPIPLEILAIVPTGYIPVGR